MRLSARGVAVQTTRSADLDVTRPGAFDRLQALITPGCAILHSIPTLPGGADRELIRAFEDRPDRVVYLSTTGVYGNAGIVDEQTPPQPRSAREHARVETERAIQSGPWQSLILRPAAIYGPERGVHIAMAQGRYTLLGDGSNYISRIHVDDLAAIAEAALLSSLSGAYPVADRHPCPAREIAEYCAQLWGLPMPVPADWNDVPESRRANRRVDGSAICRELGVTLRYPSYRDGIPLKGAKM
jgi:nucleoside-diphosphate-sugar epimerase